MATVTKRAAAERDLIEHFVYLAEHASVQIADRFLKQAELTFNDLSLKPLMGVQLSLKNPALANMRKWRVRRFDNFLIFYIPRSDGVAIVRVLHATQNWQAMLA